MFEMLWPLVLGIAIGLLLGAAGTWILALRARQRLTDDLASARARNDLLDRQVQSLTPQLNESQQHRAAAERDLAALREQLRSREQRLNEQRQFIEKVEQRFAELSAVALKNNSQHVVTLATEKLAPVKELLEKHNKAIAELESKRETAYTRLDEQIKTIAASHEKLGTETSRLVSALRRPEQRGRWGELQLRNAVELAGMTQHCDFHEQQTIESAGGGALRPDMIVKLPGGGVIPVDSKVAIDAYLDALQPDADREAQLKRHTRHVLDHVSKLADKRYWDQFDHTPGVVVMFMPLESALVAALEVNPDLHAEAMQRHVLIATPTLLVALLRAVAYGWQQEAIAANARQIADVGRELHERLTKFVGSYEKLGARLAGAVNEYNTSVGTFDARVIPSARKLTDLGAATGPELDSPAPIEIETRPIRTQELKPLPDGADASHD